MAMSSPGGNGDNISLGLAPALNLDIGTVLVWTYPTTLPGFALRGLFSKANAGGLMFNTSGGANHLVIQRNRAGGSCIAATDWANVPQAVANTWMFLGAQFDINGAATDQRLFGGSLAVAPTEAASYGSQGAGSGAVVDTTAMTAYIGNADVASAFSWPGDIAWMGVWNRLLTLTEIQQQWEFAAVTAGCVGWWLPGMDTATRVRDWSGCLHTGTATGVTISANPSRALGSPQGRPAGLRPRIYAPGIGF